MNRFTYARPDRLPAARDLLDQNGEALILAGGQSLLPAMKLGLSAPEMLVDLGGIDRLRSIDIEDGMAWIGAMCRHAEVAACPQIQVLCPGLAALAGMIGDPHVRNRGTIGGSIANNDPAADYPAACLALGATIRTDRRAIAAGDFFKGLFETALEPGEIVTQAGMPLHKVSAYSKFRNPASRFALAGVFVAKRGTQVKVAVTGAGIEGVFRWTGAEERLGSDFTELVLTGLSISPALMLADIHAQSDYRAQLVKVVAMRAVKLAKTLE